MHLLSGADTRNPDPDHRFHRRHQKVEYATAKPDSESHLTLVRHGGPCQPITLSVQADDDLPQRMAALRTHSDAINQKAAVTEEIDWFVFIRRGQRTHQALARCPATHGEPIAMAMPASSTPAR